jgi:hypothetical protein
VELQAGGRGVMAEGEEEEEEHRQIFATTVVSLGIGGGFVHKINVFDVEGEDICHMNVE